MYVCMYVYIYEQISVDLYYHKTIPTVAPSYIYIYICLLCLYLCMHVRIYIYICIYLLICIVTRQYQLSRPLAAALQRHIAKRYIYGLDMLIVSPDDTDCLALLT